MNTKQVIEKLIEADPEGTLEVTFTEGAFIEDILRVDGLVGGLYSKSKIEDGVDKLTITGAGEKIIIFTMTPEEVVMFHPEAEVEIDLESIPDVTSRELVSGELKLKLENSRACGEAMRNELTSWEEKAKEAGLLPPTFEIPEVVTELAN